MRTFARRLVAARWFNPLITLVILINAAVIGMDTSPELSARWGDWFEIINALIVSIFVVEAALKLTAVAPRVDHYFRDGWNCFDFTIVVLSLLPASSELATLARLARLLRVLRLVSNLPELRLIVDTLVRSLPGMGHVVMLMGLIFYVYAVAGYHLFHEIDPTHWSTLGISLLTLFRVVTLEDWTDVMYAAMAVEPWAWIYFVSFVVLGTFVVVNLFIAVVLNNLDDAKTERLRDLQTPPGRDEILRELRSTQEALAQLHRRLEYLDDQIPAAEPIKQPDLQQPNPQQPNPEQPNPRQQPLGG